MSYGYPPQRGGYPPQQGVGSRGYQPQQGGYQLQQGGYQLQQGGYPPQQGGYQLQQGGYQPQQAVGSNSCCCFYRVKQGEAGIIEGSGGGFKDVVAPSGCVCINPCLSKLRGTISLATRTIKCSVDSFSSDRSSVNVDICIVFRVIPSEVHTAYYKLTSVDSQIKSFIVTNVRSSIQSKCLEELYTERDELADRVRVSLGPTMRSLGFEIVDLLVVDVEVRGETRNAINAQMVQQYGRHAQALQGDIDRIDVATMAEANSEATRLRGVGTAAERQAISSAFKDGMAGFKGASAAELTATMLMIQYFDMIRDLNTKSQPSTVMLPRPRDGARSLDPETVRERLRRHLAADDSL